MKPSRVRRQSKTRYPFETPVIAHRGKHTEPGRHVATSTIGFAPGEHIASTTAFRGHHQSTRRHPLGMHKITADASFSDGQRPEDGFVTLFRSKYLRKHLIHQRCIPRERHRGLRQAM